MDLINTFSGFTVLTHVNNRILSGESFQNNLSAGAGNKKNVFFFVGIVNGIRIIVNLIMAWLTQEKRKLKTSSLFATKVDFEEFVQPVFYLTF